MGSSMAEKQSAGDISKGKCKRVNSFFMRTVLEEKWIKTPDIKQKKERKKDDIYGVIENCGFT